MRCYSHENIDSPYMLGDTLIFKYRLPTTHELCEEEGSVISLKRTKDNINYILVKFKDEYRKYINQ